MSFSPGDVVRLNSGGPLMTVLGNDHDEIVCIWDKDGEYLEANFPPETLYLTASADEDDEDMSDEELDELMAESEIQQYGYR